jgi:hypothetical protein
LYWFIRHKKEKHYYLKRYINLVLFILVTALFFSIAIKIGSRNDITAFAVGITMIELHAALRINNTKKMKLFLRCLLFLGFMLILMNIVEQTRGLGELESDRQLIEIILLKDYYAPMHILYASIALDFISPIEVILSNSANALIQIGYPYLQQTITDLFNPGIATRSQGYAFYIFSEGYIFMGFLGFLYNGIVVFLGLALWRFLANSKCELYNNCIYGLIGTHIIHLSRNQSSYFVKDFYTFYVRFS